MNSDIDVGRGKDLYIIGFKKPWKKFIPGKSKLKVGMKVKIHLRGEWVKGEVLEAGTLIRFEKEIVSELGTTPGDVWYYDEDGRFSGDEGNKELRVKKFK